MRATRQALVVLAALVVSASAQMSNDASDAPSDVPSDYPSMIPSDTPSMIPSDQPSAAPSDESVNKQIRPVAELESDMPSDYPSMIPSDQPSMLPSAAPSEDSSNKQGVPAVPSVFPSDSPSSFPTSSPVDEVTGECINAVCTTEEDCSCVPGLECRERSDGMGGKISLCSGIPKNVKNRISDEEGGIGGAVRGNRLATP